MIFHSGEDEEIEAEEVATNEEGRDDGVVVESYNGVIMLEDEGEESEDHDDDDDDDDEGKLSPLLIQRSQHVGPTIIQHC